MKRLIIVAIVVLIPALALADDSSNDVGDLIVGLVCAHPGTVAAVITFLALHAGCSGASVIIKRFMGYVSSPAGKAIVKLVRIGAGDIKPSPDVIVTEAAIAVQASPAARAAGADPTLMVAAAQAIRDERSKAA